MLERRDSHPPEQPERAQPGGRAGTVRNVHEIDAMNAQLPSLLDDGDRVVAVGQLKLQSGSAVTISNDPVPPIPAKPPRY